MKHTMYCILIITCKSIKIHIHIYIDIYIDIYIYIYISQYIVYAI